RRRHTRFSRDWSSDVCSSDLNVNNVAGTDITNPTVSITSPSNGASVSGTVSINITATDNTGISSVFYSIDGVVANTKTSAPFSRSEERRVGKECRSGWSTYE